MKLLSFGDEGCAGQGFRARGLGGSSFKLRSLGAEGRLRTYGSKIVVVFL